MKNREISKLNWFQSFIKWAGLVASILKIDNPSYYGYTCGYCNDAIEFKLLQEMKDQDETCNYCIINKKVCNNTGKNNYYDKWKKFSSTNLKYPMLILKYTVTEGKRLKYIQRDEIDFYNKLKEAQAKRSKTK